jgi:hypothetical protein
MNRDLQQYLWLFTADKQDEWVDWLLKQPTLTRVLEVK